MTTWHTGGWAATPVAETPIPAVRDRLVPPAHRLVDARRDAHPVTTQAVPSARIAASLEGTGLRWR